MKGISPRIATVWLMTLAAGSAWATTINPIVTYGANTITQTASFGASPTDVSINGTNPTGASFQDFLSLGAPVDAILDSVAISMSITESISALSLFDNDPSGSATQSFSYLSTASFGVAGTAPSADRVALLAGLPHGIGANSVTLYSIGDNVHGVAQSIDPGDNYVYLGSGTEVGTYNSTLIGKYSLDNGNYGGGHADINPYSVTTSLSDTTSDRISPYDASGAFTLGYSTSTSQNIYGSGGTLGFSQTTGTSAIYSVVYTYSEPGTPEPATFVLIGSGLLCFVLRKRFTRSAPKSA